jgi:hypothetical protein
MTLAAERQIFGLFVNPVHQFYSPHHRQSTHLALWCKLLSLLRIVQYELIFCQEMALLYETDKWATINQGSVSRYLPFRYTSEEIE